MDFKLIDRILALGNLIAHAQLAYVEAGTDLQISSWNQAAGDLFGYCEDQTMGRFLDEFVPLDQKELLTCKKPCTCVSSLIKENGNKVTCELFYTPIISIKGERLGVALLARDISRRIKEQATVKKQTKDLEDIFGFAPVGMCHVTLEGKISSANPEYAWMLGYESADAVVEQITDFAGQTFFDEKAAEEFLYGVYEAHEVIRFRCRLKRKDNSFVWALCYAKATLDRSGRMNGFNGFCMDISGEVRADEKLKEMNERLKALSLVDGLTQIPNRRKFDEYLALEWKRHLRGGNLLSVILCDIDFFKFYNDTYGHQAGDDCLQKVAQAIQASVHRAPDLCARYGGEEFVLILPCTDANGAMKVAEAVRANVNNLGIIHEQSRVNDHVTLSLGVATMVPEIGKGPQDIVALADKALYRAKDNGRNQSVQSD